MTLFNLKVVHAKPKIVTIHPWSKTIKNQYAHMIKRVHNSIKNIVYPKPKEKVPKRKRTTFTVVGIRVSKEFIYCARLVQGMHTYRWKDFDVPIIKGVTCVEWPKTLRQIEIQFNPPVCCKNYKVIVLCNGEFLGGVKELKKRIEASYIYHLTLNYQQESINEFANFVNASGRPCAYLHISIGGKMIGCLIFMLYADIVPQTCENFLRLCESKRGGYSGTPVHRIVKDGWIQCGGFGLKQTDLGCENFIVPHDCRGVLGMANDGRDIDCSTQFYVLLQPCDWMTHKYVAFGQLIGGEETLKRIERVRTFYESPTQAIIIYKSGILNLDCDAITINKSTYAYLDQHLEDLELIGEFFYQMLLENVFLELEYKNVTKLEEMGGEEVGDAVGEEFTRKKSMQFLHGEIQNTLAIQDDKPDKQNNEFDVEDYFYESEEYRYSKLTPTISVPKEKRPYYIPFTDVPYPDEIDSDFDLKRLLRGNYCLESDLDPRQSRKVDKENKEKLQHTVGLLHSYNVTELQQTPSSSSSSDSAVSQEIKKAFKLDKVCFAGQIIKNIAKNYVSDNPLGSKKPDEVFTDEEIRRIRLALQDLHTRGLKRVSFNAEPWQIQTRVKRRQTGFVWPDMTQFKSYQKEEEEPCTDEEIEERRRKIKRVSIDSSARLSATSTFKRRPTGFVRMEDIQKLFASKVEEEEEEPRPTTRKSFPEEHARPPILKHDDDHIGRKLSVVESHLMEYKHSAHHELRNRPALSVSEYHLMNKKHAEESKSKEKKAKSRAKSLEFGKGLRLPGDTPTCSVGSLTSS